MLYIGETSHKLADRFGEHLRSVEGYNHNSRYHGGGFPVAKHFNLADHNNIQDMKVSVVKQVNGGTAPRQREAGVVSETKCYTATLFICLPLVYTTQVNSTFRAR